MSNKWQELIKSRLTAKGIDLKDPAQVQKAIEAAKRKEQTAVVEYLTTLTTPVSDPELEAILNA